MDVITRDQATENSPELSLSDKFFKLKGCAQNGAVRFAENKLCSGLNGENAIVFYVKHESDELKIDIKVNDPSNVKISFKRENQWVEVPDADKAKLNAQALRLVEEAYQYVKREEIPVNERIAKEKGERKKKVDDLLDQI